MSQLNKQESRVIDTVVAGAVTDQSDMAASAIRFVQTELPPYLRAEVAVVGKDLVFHFFLLDPSKPLPCGYSTFWEERFPIHLDAVARNHFRAEFPSLQAQRVNEFEIDSWWLRAFGYADASIDMDAFIQKFYEKLLLALRS